MKTRKLLTSAAVVALALPAFTLGQSSYVNATTTPAVTAVKTSYNAKTVKPVKVSKKGQFKTTVKFTGYKDFTLTGLNAKGAAVTRPTFWPRTATLPLSQPCLRPTFTTDAKKNTSCGLWKAGESRFYMSA